MPQGGSPCTIMVPMMELAMEMHGQQPLRLKRGMHNAALCTATRTTFSSHEDDGRVHRRPCALSILL